MVVVVGVVPFDGKGGSDGGRAVTLDGNRVVDGGRGDSVLLALGSGGSSVVEGNTVTVIGGRGTSVVKGGGEGKTVTVIGGRGTSVADPAAGPAVVVALNGTVVSAAVPFMVTVEPTPVVDLSDSIVDGKTEMTLPVGTALIRVDVLTGTMMVVTIADPLMMTVARLAVKLADGWGVNV